MIFNGNFQSRLVLIFQIFLIAGHLKGKILVLDSMEDLRGLSSVNMKNLLNPARKLSNMENISTIYKISDLKQDSKAVIMYTADWCGPCRMMHPIMEESTARYPDTKFYKVDVDYQIDLATSQRIRSIPYFQFYSKGNLHSSAFGAMPLSGLSKYIKNLS